MIPTIRRLLPLLCLTLLHQLALAQISPGPLSKAHSTWDGPTKCVVCHSFGMGAPKFKCLSCHGEIRQRLKENRGFHAKIVDPSKGGQDCVRCHTDHYGPVFNIVKWDTSADEFDHRRAGYVLEGKHAGLACSRCHNPKHVSAAERRLIQVKDVSRSYLGVSTECLTCHADEHRGQLAANCAGCHSFQAWRPARGFDHAAARYQLTGLHREVECAKCHSRDGSQNFVRYTGLRFTACNDCHQDPHRGAFQRVAAQSASAQTPCQSCHTTAGWKQVRTASTFDHGRTAFPLRGKHADVACVDCHKKGNFAEPVAHARCVDCHKKDPHNGQFLHRADAGDCGGCHDETRFKPSLFTVAQHQQSDYPLVAKHATVACEKCHFPAGPDARYRVAHDACLDCHRDAHDAQFAGAPHQNRCESCHNVEGFRPSTFTLARHNESRFALKGAHVATTCEECHKPAAGVSSPPARYRFAMLACTACHEDPHSSEAAAPPRESRFQGTQSCETCHGEKQWSAVAGFDHATTGFPLESSHRAVTCAECHRPRDLGGGARRMGFRDAPTTCAGCHEDVHAGQFVSFGEAARCDSCHVVMSWKAAAFDHEKTQFSLAGAHARVPCRSCHYNKTEIGGRVVVIYKDTPKRCAACHAGE